MNAALAILAIASILVALWFTMLFKRHPFHIAGLLVFVLGFSAGMSGNYEMAFRWLCLGSVVTGISGLLTREKK